MILVDWIVRRRAIRKLQSSVHALDEEIRSAERQYPEHLRLAQQAENPYLIQFVKRSSKHARQMKDFRNILKFSIQRLRHG